jgi:predicted nuclease of predicted toxin-antitoxin system
MKLLLDECTPKRLKSDFAEHDVYTVDDAGLKGFKNGALLQRANDEFDVLVTVDQNIPFQQNFTHPSLAIVILIAHSNRYSELRTLVPKVLEALVTIKAGDVVRIQ